MAKTSKPNPKHTAALAVAILAALQGRGRKSDLSGAPAWVRETLNPTPHPERPVVPAVRPAPAFLAVLGQTWRVIRSAILNFSRTVGGFVPSAVAYFQAAGASPETVGKLGNAYVNRARSVEHAARLMAHAAKSRKLSGRTAQALNRARDRLAQRNPDWAIATYPAEYTRGVRIAWLIGAAVSHLVDRLNRGETIVCHGRDGELAHETIKRYPGARKWSKRARYVVSSRAFNTHLSQHKGYGQYHWRNMSPGLYAYTCRVLGDAPACHYDTGFSGSVPAWFRNQVGVAWGPVTAIKLLAYSGGSGKRQIEECAAWAKDAHVDLVGYVGQHMEDPCQRLETPGVGDWDFSGLRFSYDAPGFWARLYGVCDALGLPRRPGGEVYAPQVTPGTDPPKPPPPPAPAPYDGYTCEVCNPA